MSIQASEVLKFNIDKIMKNWEDRVRKEVRSASKQNSLALQNSLPDYLNKLVEVLALSSDKKASQIQPVLARVASVEHGHSRAKGFDYSISQMIAEYQILRQTIFEVIEEKTELSKFDRDTILNSIEQAVNDAATEFSSYLEMLQETFSRALIHDLQSPLTVAFFAVGMIQSSPENLESNRRAQGRIERSLERINGMICQLMDYSTIKAGQGLNMNLEALDLCELITQVAEDFDSTKAKRIHLNLPRTLNGFWDLRGLTSVMENLVTNALKYSEPNTPIDISVDGDESWVHIEVHNQGKPIPAEDQKNLFENFRRSQFVGKAAGWGLGLTIVKSIIESHGGTVGVKSTKEFGTSFTVKLPLDSRAQS